jgi:hypothetical protein
MLLMEPEELRAEDVVEVVEPKPRPSPAVVVRLAVGVALAIGFLALYEHMSCKCFTRNDGAYVCVVVYP